MSNYLYPCCQEHSNQSTVRQILQKHFTTRHTIIDPFAKFGDVLIEAKLQGVRGIGFSPQIFDNAVMQLRTHMQLSLAGQKAAKFILERALQHTIDAIFEGITDKGGGRIISEITNYVAAACNNEYAIKDWLLVLLGRVFHVMNERSTSIIPILRREQRKMFDCFRLTNEKAIGQVIIGQVDATDEQHLQSLMHGYFNFLPIDGIIMVLPNTFDDWELCPINKQLCKLFQIAVYYSTPLSGKNTEAELIARKYKYLQQAFTNLKPYLKSNADIFVISNYRYPDLPVLLECGFGFAEKPKQSKTNVVFHLRMEK